MSKLKQLLGMFFDDFSAKKQRSNLPERKTPAMKTPMEVLRKIHETEVVALEEMISMDVPLEINYPMRNNLHKTLEFLKSAKEIEATTKNTKVVGVSVDVSYGGNVAIERHGEVAKFSVYDSNELARYVNAYFKKTDRIKKLRETLSFDIGFNGEEAVTSRGVRFTTAMNGFSINITYGIANDHRLIVSIEHEHVTLSMHIPMGDYLSGKFLIRNYLIKHGYTRAIPRKCRQIIN